MKTIAIFITLLIFLFTLNSLAQELPTVTAIEIKGLKRIEEAAVKNKISLKLGEVISQEKISEDIKSIYKMGYFEDVKVDIEPFEGGVKVIYTVKEKPTIIKVSFEGNKEYDEDKLKEVVTITAGAIADVTLVNDNALRLKTFYESEGYYFAKIVPVLKKKTEDEVELTYVIEEGNKVKIKEIKFEGNKAISSRKIKKVMATSERKFYSFITGSGFYKKFEMLQDLEKIKDLYHDNGYIKVSVGEPKIEFSQDKKWMTIIITISEGPQFKVSSVDITGYKDNKEATDIKGLIKVKAGEIFSKAKMRKDVEAITSFYSDRGYALVSVSPDVIPNEEKLTVDVTYNIKPGDKFTIGRVNISGNVKTIDKVIRREVRVDEGDEYSASKIQKSKKRLEDLQYFETVDINQKPDPDKKTVDLDVNVKEKATGFLTIGGGYSSIDNLIGMVDVTQTNLFGRGYSLTLRGELGGKSSYYTIAFRDPWFLDKPLLFGINLYRQKREYVNYTRDATGFSLTFGKRYGDDWSASITYDIERTKITDVDDDADTIIKDMKGNLVTSSVTFQIINDTRDSYIDPSKGRRHSFSLTTAGLGGDTGFWKSLLDLGWYIPIFEESTLHLRSRLGMSDTLFGKKYPLYERFYIGGLDTIRGLGYGEAGPKDSKNKPIGAKKAMIFNIEYLFPIVAELKLKGLIFFDLGKGYNEGENFGSNIKYTSGFGFRWFSPFGPVKIDYGINLNKKEGESKSKIEFGFGSFF
ncbi:MAG: outer membrane protein assembly factor BamA [Thermodesulfovibrio sp.]|nr:outer membrane protein assembly factor BamA [Thermodesulfovibrio sp.]MDW7973405.1 outer membrane protein assembly factor BamA [Thermodesulfovibrio sp.]